MSHQTPQQINQMEGNGSSRQENNSNPQYQQGQDKIKNYDDGSLEKNNNFDNQQERLQNSYSYAESERNNQIMEDQDYIRQQKSPSPVNQIKSKHKSIISFSRSFDKSLSNSQKAEKQLQKSSQKVQHDKNPQDQQKSKQAQTKKRYPWLNSQTLSIQNPLIKLHNQIIDYYLMFKQQQQTHNYLLSVFHKLQGLVYKTFYNCQVLSPFLVNNVYLKDTQVQIFLLFANNIWRSEEIKEKIKQLLQNKMNFYQVKYFQVPSPENSAKEHKIGFNCFTEDKRYSLQIKIVPQQWMSYLSNINEILQTSLQAKYLFFIFDTMIRQRGLQNSIKSYLLFGLISVFIHERKRQKSRSLTQNLLKFLQYFGVGPFTQRKISYVGSNQFQIKQDSQHQQQSYSNNASGNYGNYGQFSFWISDNIDISNHMIKELFSILRNRYKLISNYNFCHCQSILYSLINPCNDQFRY